MKLIYERKNGHHRFTLSDGELAVFHDYTHSFLPTFWVMLSRIVEDHRNNRLTHPT